MPRVIKNNVVSRTGDTMTGDLYFSGAQKIIGGTGTTSDLTLQTTSGVGATGADMHFLVGNNGATEAMTILNSGNVGIGTNSPDAQLHVSGSDTTDQVIIENTSNASASAPDLVLYRNASLDSNVNIGLIQFRAKNNNASPENINYVSLLANMVDVTDGSEDSKLSLYTFRAGVETESLTINSGNVGIGTSTPGAVLDIVGGVTNTIGIRIYNVATDATNKDARISSMPYTNVVGVGASVVMLEAFNTATDNGCYWGGGSGTQQSATSHRFFTAAAVGTLTGTERVRIASDGNVGIGVSGPTAVLHLKAGTATANTGPLQFTSGTLETTARAGLMEFLAERFHLTPTSLARQAIPGILFTQTADQTVANTVTETTLMGSGVGYGLTLPANFFVAGKTVRIQLRGFFSTTGNPTGNIIVKLGSTAIATLGASSMGNAVANQEFLVWFTFTCRTTGTTGTVIGQGHVEFHTTHGTETMYDLENTTTTTINTTIAQALDITFTWGTADAANTITSTNCIVEVIN